MALRATKGDEDARCGRTLWSFLVVCGRRAWRFRCFFPVSSTERSPGESRLARCRSPGGCDTVQDKMASRSVNKVILIGNLGKDAETKFTPNGVSRSTFSIATSRRWKDQASGEWKDETDWHNIIMWRAENVATYLTKGSRVYVEGRLQTRSWDDKDGKKNYMTEIVVDELILLGGRGGDAGGGSGGGDYSQQPVSMPRSARPPAPAPAPAAAPDDFNQGITDDDVPF
jgi:single-strand DNA-binding protein